MDNNYIISVKGYSQVFVLNTDSKQEACDYAYQELRKGDFEIDEITIEESVSGEKEIQNAKRWANRVITPEWITGREFVITGTW